MKKTRFFFLLIFFVLFANSAEAATEIKSNIITPTVWNKEGGPYIIMNTVYVYAPLIIEPGTVVKFKNNGGISLVIQNVFTAIGTSSEKIIFTSVCDGNYGGDTRNYGYFNCNNGFLRGQWGWISIYDNSNTVKIKHAKILYAGIGVSYIAYKYGTPYRDRVSIENTEIRYSRTGIYIRNAIPLMKSLILSDNDIGLDITTTYSDRMPKISNSTIANNGYGVRAIWYGYGSIPIDASDNWWGDASGPYFYHSDPQKANLQGKGDRIIGNGVIFRPWLQDEPVFDDDSCSKDCNSNVMFLPGLEASRLYDNDGRVWEPYSNGDAEKLLLNESGKSIRDDIYTKDVIDTAYLPIKGNIYASFLSDLEHWKETDKIIEDYAIVPYDWRLSFYDILSDGSIVGTLRQLAKDSRTKKVTIVAHSNGGLVTKALVKSLGTEAEQLIDKIVFVAVPQSGTPQAVGAILHGYDQGLPVDWFPFALSPKTARTLAQNMPSVYNLLPSNAYFSGEGSGVTTPAVTFDEGELTKPFIDEYGMNINTFGELQAFLADTDGKVSADSDNIVSPSTVNTGLLSVSDDVHQSLDNLTIPPTISVYQIAGFGEETLGTVRYWTGKECLHEGGKICSSQVPKLEYTPELMVDGDGTVAAPSALAMSTSATNVSRWWVDLFRYDDDNIIGRKHADILEVPQLRDFIKNNILTQSTIVLPNYLSNSEPPISSEKRLSYYLHSPLALSARDSAGNEISATTSTIPGATYRRFGEVQYISLPASAHPTLVLDGLAEGSFTLEARETEGDNIVAETTYSGIPTSAETKATMNFSDGTIEGASPLVVDYDGDGTTDFRLRPKIGEVVIFDTVPPEAIIQFDPATKELAITGKDDVSGTVSVAMTGDSATLKDETSNTTVVTFVKNEAGKQIKFEMKSLAYGETIASISTATLHYEWSLAKTGSVKMLNEQAVVGNVEIHAHYLAKDDATVITKTENGITTSETKSGLVIFRLVTDKGLVKIDY